MNLINGVGESVHIIFDACMEDTGTHMVYDGKRQLIEYPPAETIATEVGLMSLTVAMFNDHICAIIGPA